MEDQLERQMSQMSVEEVAELEFHLHVKSSIEISVEVIEDGYQGRRGYKIECDLDHPNPNKPSYPQYFYPFKDGTVYQLTVLPGERHTIKVEYFHIIYENGAKDYVTKSKGEKTVMTRFNNAEQRRLYDKAVNFSSKMMEPIYFLYKAKPKEDYKERSVGDIFRKYLKEYGGQPANRINGNVEGVFFGASLFRGDLPTKSPYGDVRLDIPIEAIFTPTIKLFFADFYCISRNENHYLTVVACREGSAANSFCEKYLLPLPLDDNPFLTIDRSSDPPSFQVSETDKLWVEIFFTENYQRTAMDSYTDIVDMCEGRSRKGGFDNRKSCQHCNLYPS